MAQNLQRKLNQITVHGTDSFNSLFFIKQKTQPFEGPCSDLELLEYYK